jgi:alginate O-acetyltransferase complex protein AlgI
MPLGIAGTTLLVFLGWVPFRAESLEEFARMIRAMVGRGAGLEEAASVAGLFAVSDTIAWQLPAMGIVATALGLLLVYLEPLVRRRGRLVVTASAMVVVLFVVSIIKLTAESFSPFLYFQF